MLNKSFEKDDIKKSINLKSMVDILETLAQDKVLETGIGIKIVEFVRVIRV